MPFIEAAGLCKTYNVGKPNEVRALQEVSFAIEEGEFVVILGSSGAGKSTLLHLLGGMEEPTGGSLIIHGDDLSSFQERQRQIYRRERVGFVFQFYNLVGNLTAYENVALSAACGKDPLDPLECLEKVGIKEKASDFPSLLSGGQQQKVAIARAIAKNPALLLCDEPTGALDGKSGDEIIALLKELSEKQKKTILVVTHNADLTKFADRVIHIHDGRIASIETKKEGEDGIRA